MKPIDENERETKRLLDEEEERRKTRRRKKVPANNGCFVYQTAGIVLVWTLLP